MAKTPTKRSVLLNPGAWIIRRIDSQNLNWSHSALTALSWILLIPAAIWLERGEGNESVVFFVFVSLLHGVDQYLRAARATVRAAVLDEAKSAAIDARAEVLETVKRLNTDVMGHLAVFLQLLYQRRSSARDMPAPRFNEALRSLQQHLLTHLVTVVAKQLDIDEQTMLSANWSLLDSDGKTFSVCVYDRNMAARQPGSGRHHVIAKGVGGASEAFLTGEASLVLDTHQLPELYPSKPPYRSILSFPVILADNRVVGVVNIDCQETGILDEDHQYYFMDTAYLIGVCEALRTDGNARS